MKSNLKFFSGTLKLESTTALLRQLCTCWSRVSRWTPHPNESFSTSTRPQPPPTFPGTTSLPLLPLPRPILSVLKYLHPSSLKQKNNVHNPTQSKTTPQFYNTHPHAWSSQVPPYSTAPRDSLEAFSSPQAGELARWLDPRGRLPACHQGLPLPSCD